jgi:disulfide bond formation protein DsbB
VTGGFSWLRGHRVAVNVVAALTCFALYGYALYAEHVLGFEPCPLCMFQRFGIISLGVAFLLAGGLSLAKGRWAGYLSVALVLLATAIAAGVSGRHVYVQMQPAGTFESCGASLD